MAAPPKPVTPEDFTKLVADLRGELAEASPEQRDLLLRRPKRGARPDAFKGRAWVARRTDLREAAELTGLAYNSLRVYRNQGDRDRADSQETPRSMPAESPAGGWVLGTLALWCATSRVRHRGQHSRWPARDTYLPALREFAANYRGRAIVSDAAAHVGVTRKLARELLLDIGAIKQRTSDEDALAFLREYAEQTGRRAIRRELLEALENAGMRMDFRRATRLYIQAGGRDPGDDHADTPDPAPAESLRWDGLLTQSEVARWFDVSDALVWKARQPREDGPPLLTPVKWEADKPLYDARKITHRADMLAGPVDRGHPLAAELTKLRRGIASELPLPVSARHDRHPGRRPRQVHAGRGSAVPRRQVRPCDRVRQRPRHRILRCTIQARCVVR